jgi:hypothetical protein
VNKKKITLTRPFLNVILKNVNREKGGKSLAKILSEHRRDMSLELISII